MLLIGSRALALRAPKLLPRKPKDFDFISDEVEALEFIKSNGLSNHQYIDNKIIINEKDSTPVEFELVEHRPSNKILIELVSSDKNTVKTDFGLVPSLNVLFALKASHKYLKNSPHFWKTAFDYHVMKDAGCEVPSEYKEWYSIREKETYNYSHPKLNVTKSNFFKDDSIEYVYDHDDIHKSIALHEQPAYLYYLKDGEQVQCDKNKFFSIDEKYRLAGVVEEAAVLAIERSLVPHPGAMNPEQAWRFALAKVCSSITSGYFREFAYNNIFKVIKMYPTGYWEKFQQDVKDGKVKNFTGSKY